MIIEKLRTVTRSSHEDLEKAMQPLIDTVRDATQYARLLQLFYGYYKPLQDDVDLHIDRALLADYDQRRKTEKILDDLRSIDEVHKTIPLCDHTPGIGNSAAAFGALYVMEGSTVGGRIICKTLATHLDVSLHNGLTFFNGYGAQTGEKWKGFLTALDQFTGTPCEDVVVTTAKEVFEQFHAWLDKCYASLN